MTCLTRDFYQFRLNIRHDEFSLSDSLLSCVNSWLIHDFHNSEAMNGVLWEVVNNRVTHVDITGADECPLAMWLLPFWVLPCAHAQYVGDLLSRYWPFAISQSGICKWCKWVLQIKALLWYSEIILINSKCSWRITTFMRSERCE